MLTTDVENYPGFPDGIIGPELMMKFREQAERFGAEFVTADVDRVDFSRLAVRRVGRRPRVPRPLDDHLHRRARRACSGLAAEQRLLGHGVSTCATCDGFFFRETADRRRRRRRLRARGGDLPHQVRRPRSRSSTGATSCGRRRSCRTARSRTRRSSSCGTATVDDVDRRRQGRGAAAARHRDRATSPSSRSTGCSSPSATTRTPRCSAASSTSTTTATSSPTPDSTAHLGRRACSRAATCRTTSTARRSPPPAPAAWPPSTPSAGSSEHAHAAS